MTDPVTGEPHTAHTLNPVPFYLIHPDFRGPEAAPRRPGGHRAHALKVMGLPQPKEMNRQGLF